MAFVEFLLKSERTANILLRSAGSRKVCFSEVPQAARRACGLTSHI